MKNIFLRFKVFVFLFLLFFLSADAIAETATKKIFLFITIDVEAGSYKGKPNKLSDRIYGYIDGEYWGIPKDYGIMQEI